MIRRTLLMATAMITSTIITACSDTTAPKELAGGELGPAAQGRHASEGAHAQNLFYTTAGFGAEIFTIKVSDGRITTARLGPTNGGNCLSLALSPSGTLYSMCGPLFGTQRLATINRKTGRANLFGVPVSGLAVMAMGFARNGTLYAVGDCNPNANFECTPALTRITTHFTGSTRQPERLPGWVQLAPRNFSWTWRLIVKGTCSA
jgi:hypothetical protein